VGIYRPLIDSLERFEVEVHPVTLERGGSVQKRALLV